VLRLGQKLPCASNQTGIAPEVVSSWAAACWGAAKALAQGKPQGLGGLSPNPPRRPLDCPVPGAELQQEPAQPGTCVSVGRGLHGGLRCAGSAVSRSLPCSLLAVHTRLLSYVFMELLGLCSHAATA